MTLYVKANETIDVVWIAENGHVLQKQSITYPSHWPKTADEVESFRESIDRECANAVKSAGPGCLSNMCGGLLPGQARSY